MGENEELTLTLIALGRNELQDCFARSRNASDATAYLLAELNFELARATLFKTKDLVTFQRRKDPMDSFSVQCLSNES